MSVGGDDYRTNVILKNDGKHIIITGCQIHYTVKCNNKPNAESCDDWQADAANGIKRFKTPSKIYIAQ